MAVIFLVAFETSGCGEGKVSPDVPLGDRLDELLAQPALPNLYAASVRTCVVAQGVDATPLDDSTTESTELPAVESGPGSGLTKSAIESLNGTAADQQVDQSDLGDPLALALTGPVTMSGVPYDGGCLEYGEAVLARNPAEVQRMQLQKSYGDEVGVRLRADPTVA
ncbi:MAG: hypothetical protein WCC60_11555, partial [Ilumatobacteraceae bacterium]